MNHPYPIAGGMFGKEPATQYAQCCPPFLQGTHLKLQNARSGINVLCNLLKPARVWIPSYICESVPRSIPGESTTLFYPISRTLQVEDSQWINHVHPRDLVIFVDYFGFSMHQQAMSKAKAQGAWILQDAAQALLSSFERSLADFILYSPRKFFGVPDGGILESKCSVDFSTVELKPASEETEHQFETAFSRRTAFDEDGQTSWFDAYQAAEKLNCTGPFKMTKRTDDLLENGLNYSDQALRRRRNFNRIQGALNDIALFRELPPNVVPLGFPVLLESRDNAQQNLFNKQIYCPVHWATEKYIPASFTDSRFLSSHMLTLLCDQRMSDDQIDSMIEIVRDIL
jgi:hypothetical protein